MSNSSISTDTFRVADLQIAGEGAWSDLEISGLSPRLNVFFAGPRAGKSSVAQLVGQLLYGKTNSPWRQQFNQSVSNADGSLRLDGRSGSFVLRRQSGADRQTRLTISSNHGDSVDGQTIQSLLGGLSPELASKVFSVDFAESPRASWLLTETFSRELNDSKPYTTRNVTNGSYGCCESEHHSWIDLVDGQKIDELVKRRDAIAGEIEQQLAKRRNESEILDREIKEADSAVRAKRGQMDRLRVQLHRLDSEIAELETRLRYHSLDHHSKSRDTTAVDRYERGVVELDEEISRCRQSLSDTQHREQFVRAELAQYGSDGTADRVTCLADGRVTIGVMEQLLNDLDAEVAQLARAHEPGRCVGHDAHAKLSPVAALLRQQVYTLCGQLTEQERIAHRQQLTAESKQLTRVHAELGDRLDLLLSQRESLIQRSQLSDRAVRSIPQPPVIDHCDCEHHGTFVQSHDVMAVGRSDRGRLELDARDQLATLQRQRAQLIEELDGLQSDLQHIESRWEKLQRERAGLISGASLEQQQTELERLESVIRQSLQAHETTAVRSLNSGWRASDVLAQLTDGELVQIRIDRQLSQPTVVDRRGKFRSLESLSASEHDQLYVALTLSIVSSYGGRGIHLPLVLDEPFLHQDAPQAAAMLGVLDEFARAGHQVFVFTEDREVSRRCATLNVAMFDLDALRQTKVEPQIVQPPVEAPVTVQTTNTRIVRQTNDGLSTPTLRLAPVEGNLNDQDEFYLTEHSNFDEFPLLGSETTRIFSNLEIHTVADLLAVDATDFATRLRRSGIHAETVELWQIHMALMCYVPNLTLDDAQVLAANGVDSPADLFDVDIDALLHRIESFMRSEHAYRFQRSSGRYSRNRLSGWRSGARRYQDRWQRNRNRYSGWSGRRSRRTFESGSQLHAKRSTRDDSNRRTTKSNTARKTRRSEVRATKSRRFYLSRTQDVEAAPSIGPKTAERLAKVGIRTVADLLNADPTSTAAELDVSHITAETLTDWQNQAKLVCQIPGLRGYGAQLLVACGMTQPEQIAGRDASQLVAEVLAYCETKEGQRILRSGEPPKVEKIAEWVELAGLSRSLDAA